MTKSDDSDKKPGEVPFEASEFPDKDGMKVIFVMMIEGRKVPFYSRHSRSETARIMREIVRKVLRQSR